MTYEYSRRHIKDLWGSSSRRRFLSSELCDMAPPGCSNDADLHIALSWAIEPPRPLQLPQIHPLIQILNSTGAEIHPSLHKHLSVSFSFLDKHQGEYVLGRREEFQSSLCCKMRCIPLFSVTFLLCLGYLL